MTSKTRSKTFFRASFCTQGATVLNVYQYEFYSRYIGYSAYRRPPLERRTMIEVESLAELDAVSEHSSYYYDGEWVHVKLVGEFDVTVGGVMEDERGEIVEYEPRLVLMTF